MAQSKKLTLGNHIYLYQLLCSQIPCGRQTFIPQVESVLEAADLAAADLGFKSTRELLEELDDFIKLTVFKGGRIYATVIAQPAWDEALAANAKKSDAPQGKSWKKKRGDKSLKAVRPRHVPKAPEPEPVAEPEPMAEAEAVPATEVEPAAEAATETETAAENAPQADAPEAINCETPRKTEVAAADGIAEGAATEDEPAAEAEPKPKPNPEAPRPAVSLKVLYDPDNANAGATTLESTPYEPPMPAEDASAALPIERLKEQASEPADPSVSTACAASPAPSAPTEPAPVTTVQAAPVAPERPTTAPAAPVQAPAPAAAAPKPAFSFEGYPTDFHTEVFCPGPQLSELSSLLPWGADALGIAGEYYWIARESGTIEATRSRAVFPLRYTQDGERHEAHIEMRRRNGPGASWVIETVYTEDESDGDARA